jgi:VWFA-related protein
VRALALAAVLAAAASTQQSFRVGVEGVRVDVLVLDGRTPVRGLGEADFELSDSGVAQRISSVQLEDVPLSVLFALDVSQSVQGEPLRHLQEAASSASAMLSPADRAALLTFSSDIVLRAPWSGDLGAMHRALSALTAGGSTSLHDAAHASLAARDSAVSRTLVLLFSDGEDTSSWLPGESVLEGARRTDAVVYGIGLRPTGSAPVAGFRVDFRSGLLPESPRVLPTRLSERFLRALADETGGDYLEANRSDSLKDTFQQVMREFRSRYLLTYTPRGVESGGWHPLEVRVKGRRLKVTARRGYAR